MKELIGKKIDKIDFDDDRVKLIHLSDGSILKFETIIVGGSTQFDYLGIATQLKKGDRYVPVETK